MRTVTDDIEGVLHTLGTVEAVLLSRIWPVLSEQSVDCEEVLLVGGGRRLLLKSRAWSEEDVAIELCEADAHSDASFAYGVDLSDGPFRPDGVLSQGDGRVEGIRLRGEGVYLFIFAMDDQLAVTQSFFDLFDEDATDVREVEARLKLVRREEA